MIVEEPELLGEREVRERVPRDLVSEVHVYGVVGSTNDLARRFARGRRGTNILVLAESQTAGRGRRNRAWFSPEGVGLWFSLALWPEMGSSEVGSLGLLAGMAVASAIRKKFGADAAVKWPNDVLIGRRKICGILSETERAGKSICAVVGIGINVNQREEDFPEKMRMTAGSLRTALGRSVCRSAVLEAVLEEFGVRYRRFQLEGFRPFVSEWERLSMMVGRRVRFTEDHEAMEGTALGVDETGALRVALSKGTEHVVIAGDVWLIE